MQALLRFLLYVLAFIAGGVLLAIGGDAELGANLLDSYRSWLQLPGGRIASASLGILLLLIPLGILVRWYAARRFAREITYATDVGQVSVSLIAIEEALTRALDHEREVRKVQVRVFEDRVKHAVIIEAALTLWDDGDVTSINRRCQDLLRRRFAELMPEQQAVQVHLTVYRLNKRSSGETRIADANRQSEPTPVKPAPTTQPAGPAVPLPGLVATHGHVGNEAGAALLKSTKADGRKMSDIDEVEEDLATRAARAAGALPPAPPPAPQADEPDELVESEQETPVEDPSYRKTDTAEFRNLYVGPIYPVDDDDED